jgi:hypothetical protein
VSRAAVVERSGSVAGEKACARRGLGRVQSRSNVILVESVCEDPEIIQHNIRYSKT